MFNQLTDTLNAGGLLSKYDPGEIFAVDQFFNLKKETITNGQAMRHALAHNLFVSSQRTVERFVSTMTKQASILFKEYTQDNNLSSSCRYLITSTK